MEYCESEHLGTTENISKSRKITRRKLLIIHGVGDFDEKTITTEVRSLVERYGVAGEDVSAFNWDQEIGGPFKGFNLDLGILAELGAGLLNLANLGFVQTSSPYGGIPQWYLRFQNWIFAVGQMAFSFFVFLLALAFFTSWSGPCLLSVIAVLLAASVLGAAVSSSIQGFVVSFRRFVVTMLWPTFHFIAAPVGFGLIALAALLWSTRIFNTVEFGIHNELLWMLFYIALRLATAGTTLLASWLALLFVRPVLKALSDVARYIVLAGHREKLKCLLSQELEQAASDCDGLIILAHSLGSVIAVDSMLACKSIFSSLEQLDFVTMGSPLRRLFHGCFPEIYAPVEIVNQALRSSINRFAWINVYRPLDFIGAHLSDSESTIVEFSTNQLFKNHTNYWRDPVVAELIAKGINEAKRTVSNSTGRTMISNWPPELCTESYHGGISQLWKRRLHVFQGAFFGLITWQIIEMIKLSLKSDLMRSFFSPSFIREMAKDDGWISTIFGWVWLVGMMTGGMVFLIRFLYKKVWHEWFGAYGSTLLGCIEEARQSPLMRYTRRPDVLNSKGN
jgi:hypothetical protein